MYSCCPLRHLWVGHSGVDGASILYLGCLPWHLPASTRLTAYLNGATISDHRTSGFTRYVCMLVYLPVHVCLAILCHLRGVCCECPITAGCDFKWVGC